MQKLWLSKILRLKIFNVFFQLGVSQYTGIENNREIGNHDYRYVLILHM